MNQLQAEFSSVKGVSITFEDYAREQQVAGLISEDNYLSSIIRD